MERPKRTSSWPSADAERPGLDRTRLESDGPLRCPDSRRAFFYSGCSRSDGRRDRPGRTVSRCRLITASPSWRCLRRSVAHVAVSLPRGAIGRRVGDSAATVARPPSAPDRPGSAAAAAGMALPREGVVRIGCRRVSHSWRCSCGGFGDRGGGHVRRDHVQGLGHRVRGQHPEVRSQGAAARNRQIVCGPIAGHRGHGLLASEGRRSPAETTAARRWRGRDRPRQRMGHESGSAARAGRAPGRPARDRGGGSGMLAHA